MVATRQAKERLACTQMNNQGISAFLPLIKRTAVLGARRSIVRKPLFPGYIFVEYVESASRWRSINSTLGVKYILMQNEKPSVLPEGFVEFLLDNRSEDGVIEQHRFLKAGDQAAIAMGPFANKVGKLLDVDSKGRAAILLSLLSSTKPVITRIENLVPA